MYQSFRYDNIAFRGCKLAQAVECLQGAKVPFRNFPLLEFKGASKSNILCYLHLHLLLRMITINTYCSDTV